MANANWEGAQKKAERLKKFSRSKALIKSPIDGDPVRNPCLKEQTMCRQCWLDNEFDTKACKAYYDNYAICMKFWNRIEWERKMKGIYPPLPPLEERPDILEKKIREFQEDKSVKGKILQTIFGM